MARSTTDSCCLTLPLRLEKWQEDRLEKRLEIARQIYNTLLLKKLKKLRYYQSLPEDVKRKDKRKLLNALGLSEYSFKTDIKQYYKYFIDNIGSSVAVHCIADQVWTAFDKVLYGNGKEPHLKKKGEMFSIRGAANTSKTKDGQYRSGGLEIIYEDGVVKWKGLSLPVKLDPNNSYETQMLSHRVKYCRLLKRVGKNKNRYYVQLILECKPVIKTDPLTGQPRHPIGHGRVGLDLRPTTLAYASTTECGLVQLASRLQSIEHEKRLILRKMDRSRRATNPDNYAPNGTIIREKELTWNKSHRYEKLQHKLASLYAHQAAIRKFEHNKLANHLLSLGDEFVMEQKSFSNLAKRATKTEISEKTGRFKRKKRFGKSIANCAPAMLITMLSTKLQSRGLSPVIKVPPDLNAGRFNHITQTYEPKALYRKRNIMLGDKTIRRNMYSAFLLQHVNLSFPPDSSLYDIEALNRDYPLFCTQYDAALSRIRESG
jgi:hypothetical protein